MSADREISGIREAADLLIRRIDAQGGTGIRPVTRRLIESAQESVGYAVERAVLAIRSIRDPSIEPPAPGDAEGQAAREALKDLLDTTLRDFLVQEDIDALHADILALSSPSKGSKVQADKGGAPDTKGGAG